MKIRLINSIVCVCFLAASHQGFSQEFEDRQSLVLEEIIVTAKKRLETEQETPIAISVLGEQALAEKGIASLVDLSSGAIPTLKVSPSTTSPMTLVFFLRGVGNTDAEQVTKESGVGLYLDGVYLSRAQGLGMDLADLERIEVLRGPQGTMFGRNSVGGAINMTSKGPLGAFSVSQSLTVGSFGNVKTVSHLDLPSVKGISSKISYVYAEQDG